ncbi:MAG: hypothetical protein V5A88_10210, partial [Candidatus Thermoplasmatota archaeon]
KEGAAEDLEENETQAPYQIYDWYDLNDTRGNLGADYIMMNDLDQDTAGYDELVNTTDGWNPIGNENNYFTGTFDGNRFKIKDLYIDRRNTDYVGLFSYMGSNANIVYLGLESVNITGGNNVGGLIGGNGGYVYGSFVHGSITGNNYVGGLVGYATTDDTSSIDVNNSYMIGSVDGTDYVGGLIGYSADALASYCYSTASVTGSSNVGPLIGSGTSWAGALDSYWNMETSGHNVSTYGEGRNTTEMTWEYLNTYHDWDFNNTWTDGDHATVIDQEGNWGYPALEWQEWVEPASNFSVNVNNISAGEEPLIEILDVEHEDGTPVEGELEVDMTINGTTYTENLTFSSGEANYTWDVITEAGTYTAEVTIDGVMRDDTFTVDALGPDSVSLGTQPQDTEAGQIINGPPEASVEDRYGNAVEGVDVEVYEDGGYDFDSGTTIQTTGGNGVATFDDLVINTTGTYQLVFNATGVPENATSNTFEINSSDANSLEILDAPVAITAGTSFDLTVQATDEYGNPAEGQALDNFEIESEYDGVVYSEANITLDGNGNYTATILEGEVITADDQHTLMAYADTVSSDSVNISVEPDDADNVSVHTQPQDTEAGQIINGPPEALVEDQYGNAVEGLDVEVYEDGGYGFDSGTTIQTTGSDGVATFDDLVINTAGTYQLVFNATGVPENATSIEFQVFSSDPHYIEINPQSSTVPAGDTQNYTATAYDEYDNEIEDVTSDTVWSIESGAGGSWSGNIYTSENAGNWTVTGAYSQATNPEDDATLNVEAAEVYHVEIVPSDNQTIDAGQTIDFSAEAFDEHGNTITDTDTDFDWDGTNGNGTFYEEEVGIYYVQAHYDTVSSMEIEVEVIPAEADHIEITPQEKDIPVGGSISYTAIAYDGYENEIEEVTNETTWDIEEGAGGGWDQENGNYTSENVGTWNVTAVYTHNGNEMTDDATVNVIESNVERIEIFPREATILAGETQEYNATAYDSEGNEFDVTADTNWSIEDGAGGEWDGNVYTSEFAGTWIVIGTYTDGGEELTDNATLIVEPADVDHIMVEPEDETIISGETLTYYATAYDEFGNEIGDVTGETNWSIEEGA